MSKLAATLAMLAALLLPARAEAPPPSPPEPWQWLVPSCRECPQELFQQIDVGPLPPGRWAEEEGDWIPGSERIGATPPKDEYTHIDWDALNEAGIEDWPLYDYAMLNDDKEWWRKPSDRAAERKAEYERWRNDPSSEPGIQSVVNTVGGGGINRGLMAGALERAADESARKEEEALRIKYPPALEFTGWESTVAKRWFSSPATLSDKPWPCN
jgi:hypothetical protein